MQEIKMTALPKEEKRRRNVNIGWIFTFVQGFMFHAVVIAA